ncbi:MAG: gliding motility protein GldN [Salinivirgaceae bacterium]|nr:gliding motility protein GldN [Salinivirgaceae bacterium]MDD4746117.1 gliding motility protein GldN [Salinivirgaceae bacterium]MDY0279851.1 gliding motility protein GldN [Salinivirgaceae bacterium]
MKRYALFLVLIVGCLFGTSTMVKGQTFNRVGVYDEEHVPARKPIPYYYLHESDVMWKKRIWRVVDMREKMNHPLYFPVEPIMDRMSLISLILRAQQGLLDEQTDRIPGSDPLTARLDPSSTKIPILQLYEDEFFKKVLTISDIEMKFGVDPTNPNSYSAIAPEEVIQWMVKEDWFFNKERSRIEVRILGLCAIRAAVQGTTTGANAQVQFTRPFWVYFPELRPILAKYSIFNSNNDAERRTFDDIFFKRFFSSYIVQESNVYNDRTIFDYELGIYGLWEAEIIKNKIFDLEQDLWSY